MKIMHMADLHFGKNLYDLSLCTEGDQAHMAEELIRIAREEKPDLIVIAGDFFDRRSPSPEARVLAGDFLTELCADKIPVALIAGNHDSGENIEYLQSLLRRSGLYVAGVISEKLETLSFEDAWGEVRIYLLPYFFPASVNAVLRQENATYTEAAAALIAGQHIDTGVRNVLVAHQTVISGGERPHRGGSETVVGGVGLIDASAFAGFDYVALGHIHRPQCMGSESIRYAGSPMCYHFDEAGAADGSGGNRGALIVELEEKGKLQVRMRTIAPLHPLRTLRGTLEETEKACAELGRREYVRFQLTDATLPPDVMERLQARLNDRENVLVCMERVRNYQPGDLGMEGPVSEDRSMESLFLEYWKQQNQDELPSEEAQALIRFAGSWVEEHPELDADVLAQQLLTYIRGGEAGA